MSVNAGSCTPSCAWADILFFRHKNSAYKMCFFEPKPHSEKLRALTRNVPSASNVGHERP